MPNVIAFDAAIAAPNVIYCLEMVSASAVARKYFIMHLSMAKPIFHQSLKSPQSLKHLRPKTSKLQFAR